MKSNNSEREYDVVTVLENKSRRRALGKSRRDLAEDLRISVEDVIRFETRDDMLTEDYSEIGLQINDYLSRKMCECDAITHRKLRIKELAFEISGTSDPNRVQYFTGHMMAELGFLNMNLSGYDRGKGTH